MDIVSIVLGLVFFIAFFAMIEGIDRI